MIDSLSLPHGELSLPAFLPDATLAVVRTLDSADLEGCGTPALVMNTFHLMQRPGSSTIQALGGLHRMSGWRGPIMTDSGGFQAYSLIRENAKYGTISNRGLDFKPDGAERKFSLTPEKTIQLQVSYGADIVVCLDDCTHVDEGYDAQVVAVKRTIDWAKRCKDEFSHLMQQKKLAAGARPLLFGVIQGGGYRELRQRCADALLEIGFDGFGFGGWPLDAKGNLLTEIIGYTREMIPRDLPMHALGVGHPVSVVQCHDQGYEMADSALPTRDARHGRLYTFTSESGLYGDWFAYLYATDDKLIKADRPISPHCDCLTCTRYSLGYLYHLFKLGDAGFMRLATIHNLRFMAQLGERYRARATSGGA